MTLGILASGKLGFHVLSNLRKLKKVVFVMTDKKSHDIINYCTNEKIDLFVGNPRFGNSVDFIKNKNIDVLISINYLFLIEKELISLPKLLAFNVHGSLLPKYRGRTPHVWAIINNEKKTGITAHLIDEGCDTGDILLQNEVLINQADTGNDILKKFELLYPSMIEEIINQISSNKLNRKPQDRLQATHFPKRDPEDGEINWNWQKERIYNWVRAQANPYPGAFTFLNGNKIIIDKIKFSEMGFSWTDPNGLILSDFNGIFIKTPNGVVELSNIRENGNLLLKGKILGR